MARPNTRYRGDEIAGWNWYWTTSETGGLQNEDISTAALVAIAHTLSRIENLLLSIGRDGIHSLIQITSREARDRDYRRRRRARVAKKRRAKLRRVA